MAHDRERSEFEERIAEALGNIVEQAKDHPA
jgi:hypothetical protein